MTFVGHVSNFYQTINEENLRNLLFRVLATKTIETSSNIIMLHEADYAGSSRIELLQRYNRRERKREGEKFVEMIEDTSTREISSCDDVRV